MIQDIDDIYPDSNSFVSVILTRLIRLASKPTRAALDPFQA